MGVQKNTDKVNLLDHVAQLHAAEPNERCCRKNAEAPDAANRLEDGAAKERKKVGDALHCPPPNPRSAP